MRILKNNILIIILTMVSLIGSLNSKNITPDRDNQVDMQEVLVNWSLFFEDFRNENYERAIPYGWKVMELHPTRFTTLYRNLAECYRQLYLAAEPDEREVYADTMIIVWEKGIEYLPDRTMEYLLQIAFIYENYYSPPRSLEAIETYEKVMEFGFDNIEYQYIDRLGSLYIDNMKPDNDFRDRAINLYERYLEDGDPGNTAVLDRLRQLYRDPRDLIRIAEEKLIGDPENPANIWGLVRAYSAAGELNKAIPYLERLTEMYPDSETYWKELARIHERLGNSREAINVYEQLHRLKPNDRDIVLQIARSHRTIGNYRQARTSARRAARMDPSWGEPLLEIAAIYEEIVEECVVNVKGGWGNMKLEDRIVYKLAQEYYERAAQIDPRITSQANQRAQFLNTLIPQDEDYFFNRELIEDGRIKVFGNCYVWIDESISVPPQFR